MELKSYADLCEEDHEEIGEMLPGMHSVAQPRTRRNYTRSMDIRTSSVLVEDEQQQGLQAYQCRRFHQWVLSQAHSHEVQEETEVAARPVVQPLLLVSGMFVQSNGM